MDLSEPSDEPNPNPNAKPKPCTPTTTTSPTTTSTATGRSGGKAASEPTTTFTATGGSGGQTASESMQTGEVAKKAAPVSCSGCREYCASGPSEYCSRCAGASAIPGKTFGDKRNTFLAMPITEALNYDKKVPVEWIRQYIGQRAVSLYEHLTGDDCGGKLLGKSQMMVLLDQCRLIFTPRRLSDMLEQRGARLRGSQVTEILDVFADRFPEMVWQETGWQWVHAVCPRVIDVWNIRTNAKSLKPNSHAYSILMCYYQNLGECSQHPPSSFAALKDLWALRNRNLLPAGP